ncbi:hypothetical protein U8527_21460 [Kordia algicida OT-1]|uniref:Uncharacterized protein n=1 Tax=Kordia algicida OT-1 TaxID=391587 RepID=A9DLJ8_9FLAO|nr:hypothetical protein [Kordia algicida]EDP98582.1 hypothetical protein KAOT1_15232 [Kordia algicida OT-1]
MKPRKTYLKGKSVFIVSLIVILVTAMTVYISGINSHRSITTNFYISLGIIATSLFLFLTYGLYKGIRIMDNFPRLRHFKFNNRFESSADLSNTDIFENTFDVGEGIVGIIVSIIMWFLASIVLILLLMLLETVFLFSLFIIIAMLYWVFFRAVRLVFSKASQTKGNFGVATVYAFGYTVLYIGWIFGIVYVTTIFS